MIADMPFRKDIIEEAEILGEDGQENAAVKEPRRSGKNPQKEWEHGEKAKKQILLRLSPGLWEDLSAWASDDFRSLNGQIEYLLSEAVKKRKKQ